MGKDLAEPDWSRSPPALAVPRIFIGGIQQ
jgi:hypothetical protein